MRNRDELQLIKEIIAASSDGIGIEQLLWLHPFQIEKRALQRQLKSIREKNLILKKGIASEAIKSEVKKLQEQDQSRFTEVVETELLGLHEGNFVRYRIRPSEFTAWKKQWDS